MKKILLLIITLQLSITSALFAANAPTKKICDNLPKYLAGHHSSWSYRFEQNKPYTGITIPVCKNSACLKPSKYGQTNQCCATLNYMNNVAKQNDYLVVVNPQIMKNTNNYTLMKRFSTAQAAIAFMNKPHGDFQKAFAQCVQHIKRPHKYASQPPER